MKKKYRGEKAIIEMELQKAERNNRDLGNIVEKLRRKK